MGRHGGGSRGFGGGGGRSHGGGRAFGGGGWHRPFGGATRHHHHYHGGRSTTYYGGWGSPYSPYFVYSPVFWWSSPNRYSYGGAGPAPAWRRRSCCSWICCPVLWCVLPLMLIFSLAAPWSTSSAPSDLAQGEQYVLDVSPTWHAGVTLHGVQTATHDSDLNAYTFSHPPPLLPTPISRNETTSLSVHGGDFEFVGYFFLDGQLDCTWTMDESLNVYAFDTEARYIAWRDEGEDDYVVNQYGKTNRVKLQLENTMGVVAFENEGYSSTAKGSITCQISDRQYDLSHPTRSCDDVRGEACLLPLPFASDTVIIVAFPEDAGRPTATARLRYDTHGRLLAYWLIFGGVVLLVALCAGAAANRKRRQWEAYAVANPSATGAGSAGDAPPPPNYGATSNAGYPAAPPQAAPAGSPNPYDAYRSNPSPSFETPPYATGGGGTVPQQWQKAPPSVNPGYYE